MYFKDFMDHIANNHGLIKETDGSVISLHMVLPQGLHAHVIYDALDPNKRGYIRTGSFTPPTTREGRARFMNFLLEFNRNAIGFLDVGLAVHPKNDHLFSLTWYASKQSFSLDDWVNRLDLYEKLSMAATDGLQLVMTEWAHSLH